MRSLFVLLSLFALGPTAVSQSPSDSTQEIDGIRFRLAAGLSVERIASEPLIHWPIVADFDREGRLVVAESGGVASPIAEHNQQGLHKIVRLVDLDGDGKYDQRIVAADEFPFPEGVLCIGDSILVAAPPQIWKLTDTDGDGVCEGREIWYDGATITHCANDLHGPYLGPDGFVYWCKGAFAQQQHVLQDGRELDSTAAHIYRRSLDGGPIDMVVAGGMDNPVEVAFTPEGDRFFTSTFLIHPQPGKRDGIAHAVYGALFGKDHSVVNGHPRTGDLMPIMTHLGPAAPSGLACLGNHNVLPEPTSDAHVLVAALFNQQRVTAHRLIPSGASFATADQDLLVADRVDFHPTDILQDADGSLIVVDTGGWYNLCCPTSRVDQKTAGGGIYRIRSQRTTETISRVLPSWNAASPTQLIDLTSDIRPWIRREARRRLGPACIERLAEQLNSSIPESVPFSSDLVDNKLNAIWGLCQIGTPKALSLVGSQLQDPNPTRLVAALNALAVHRERRFLEQYITLLSHPSLPVVRAAAEAIGRTGNADATHSLLAADDRDDRHARHSIAYALIEILRIHPELDPLVAAKDSVGRYRAILALSQTDRVDDLEPQMLMRAASGNDPQLRELAKQILVQNPDWANQLDGPLTAAWDNLNGNSDLLADLLIAWKYQPHVQTKIARWIDQVQRASSPQQQFLITHLLQLTPTTVPDSWAAGLIDWLGKSNQEQRNQLIDQLSEVKFPTKSSDTLTQVLLQQALASEQETDVLRCLTALPSNQSIPNPWLETLLVDRFVSGSESSVKLANKALQRVKLSKPLASRLLSSLDSLPASRLTTTVQAIRRVGEPSLDIAMLGQLPELKSARTLSQDYLINTYKKSNRELRALAEVTSESITEPTADIQKTVEALLEKLPVGDPTRGLQVFRGDKAQCAACHRMGYPGGDIGPVLTRIGSSRTREALLEAILFPSARLEQSYRSTKFLTVDGEVFQGLVKNRTSESVEIQLAADRKVILNIDQIEEEVESDVSIMPTGLAEQLSLQELSDLLSLLQAAK